VETARQFSSASGFHKLGLFGTRFTMQARLYPDAFALSEMTVVSPEANEQNYIHEKYMTEFVAGASLSETRARLLEIASRLKTEENIDALILGGTELPLVLQPKDGESIKLPFVDTSQIHVDAIVEEMIAG
jgi:aspartate racemase